MRPRAATTFAACLLVMAATAACGSPDDRSADRGPLPTRPIPEGKGSGVGNDVNGDGYPDLIVGSGRYADTGYERPAPTSLVLVYGGRHGPDPRTRTVITRSRLGLPGKRYGYMSVAAARDLDGDRYADLVIRADDRAFVLWGGPKGPSGDPTALAALPATMHVEDVAFGDFDGDGACDLVRVETLGDPGAGITGYRPAFVRGPFGRDGSHRSTARLPWEGGAEWSDLVTVDANGDRAADLAAGSQNKLFLGGAGGPRQGGPDVPAAGIGSGFDALGSGDFDRDGKTDLVLGDASQDVDQAPADDGPGAVIVYPGPRGFAAPQGDVRRFDHDTPGIPGEKGLEDFFGFAIGVGDLDADGYDDVVVDSRPEAPLTLHGGPDGLTAQRARSVHGALTAAPGSAGADGETHITVTDFDQDGRDDVLVASFDPDRPSDESYSVYLSTAKGVPSRPDLTVSPSQITSSSGTSGPTGRP